MTYEIKFSHVVAALVDRLNTEGGRDSASQLMLQRVHAANLFQQNLQKFIFTKKVDPQKF